MGPPGSVRSLPGRLPAGAAPGRSDRRPVPRRPVGQPVPGPGASPRARRNPGAPRKETRTTSTGIRKLLALARERLDPRSEQKLGCLLQAGDPRGEVRDAWHANETVRVIYQTSHPGEGDEYTRLLAVELQDQSCSPELNQLGRTLHTWHSQIVAWHHARVGNGPTESANNLIKRVKRVAFGFRNFRNYRTRILLYAGKPTRTYTTSPPKIRRANLGQIGRGAVERV